MKNKYLFIDIDGCLTSIDDGNHYLCKNPETYGKCDRTIELLKRIARETGCKLVVSSNWRRFGCDGTFIFDGFECKNPLPRIREQLESFLFGDLPHDRGVNKSQALTLWFEDHGLDYDQIAFAVIDDDLTEGFYENPNFKSNYFFCNYHHGLTDEIAKEIISHLNKMAAS